MKKELFYYACPPNRARQVNTSFTNKKESVILFLCGFLILSILSVPMLISNTFLCLVYLTTYIICLLFSRRDKDPYSKTMFLIFVFIAYLGIVLAYGIEFVANRQFQTSVWYILIITTILGVLFYEFGVFINILLKKYSNKDKKTYVISTASTAFSCLAGASLGRLINRIDPEGSWHIYAALVVCSLVLIVAFSFLQKYILYKIMKNKES